MIDTVTLKITPQDVAERKAGIVATYSDSGDPTNTKTVNIDTAVLETGGQQLAELDNIHEHYQAQVTRDAAIAAWIADLETTGAANLQARL